MVFPLHQHFRLEKADQLQIEYYLSDSQATSLCHSNELVALKPSRCTVSPISTHFISLLNNFLRL